MRCPTCNRDFVPESSKTLPFCCERCREIDLGRWLGEQYSVPVERQFDDDESPEFMEEPRYDDE